MCLQQERLWNTAHWEMQWNPWLQAQQGISAEQDLTASETIQLLLH